MLKSENVRKRIFTLLLGLYLIRFFYSYFEYFDSHVHIHKILFSFWPNYSEQFAFFDLSADAFKVLLACGIVLSAALAMGYRKPYVVFALWLIFSAVWVFNPLAKTVYAGFVGWCLLATLFFDTPEELTVARYSWYLFGFIYTISGLYKLTRPEWIEGNAIPLILQSSLGNRINAGLIVPHSGSLKVLTWLALGIELVALPFCSIKSSRPIIFFAIVVLHAGIAAFILSKWFVLGILLFNAYLMIYSQEWPKWIKRSAL